MRAQAPKGELIYSAKADSTLVAALRLSPVGDVLLLRSMCVSSDKRRQGIGQQFLQELQAVFVSHTVYCFPFSHLQDFYQQAGFILTPVAEAPEAIRDKFNRYLNNGKDICLMKHQPSGMLK